MNPEESKNTGDLTKPRNTLGNSISSALFYLAILFFIIGFNFSDVMVGNWYQQFMPNLNGRLLSDITFTDSLNGYAVTSKLSNISYLLKTTNGGDNWSIIYTDTDSNIFTCVNFLNTNTGFVGGYIRTGFSVRIMKTTNGGINWINVNTPMFTYQADMHVLNEDTIWFAMDELSSGGVFFTSNGGTNWQVQYTGLNPSRIYMYDRNFGFASYNASVLLITTNSGLNWVQVPGTDGFNDIKFVDNLTGWKASGPMKKTTNGGLNWVQQTLPSGGQISSGSGISKFSLLSRDTIWGTGGVYYLGPGSTNPRGFLYRTIDGGNNWLFQIPDTNFQVITEYSTVEFVNHKTGWAYTLALGKGIHTTTGGDTEWITGITQISSEVPKDFKLYQNYPNPFNPSTNIRYSAKGQTSNVKLIIFDVTSRHIIDLIDQKQNAGIYEVDFNGSEYSSGVYFYSLIIEGNIIDTKKMILIK